MYKNIIPNLVSIETNIQKMYGSCFLSNFDFYGEIKEKNKFHYKILLKNNLKLPKNYDFRSGYFFKKDNLWFFERKILFWKLKFCYDEAAKIFYFNKAYAKFPVEIGYIFPVGRHIEDFINLELFLASYLVFRGAAFSLDGKNIALIAPSFNGKTSLLGKVLSAGGQYISDDILVMNLEENKLYPITNFHNFGRKANQLLRHKLSEKNIIADAVALDKIIIFQNATNLDFSASSKTFFQYLNLNSLLFLKNHFIRACLFSGDMTDKVFDKINDIKSAPIVFSFYDVKNFNFGGLFAAEVAGFSDANKKHWEGLNINYNENWKSVGRQEMSKREMAFIDKYLNQASAHKILDIGVGTGRILGNLLANSVATAEIFGLDISKEMVRICRDRFLNQAKVKDIKVCDIAMEEICYENDFNFITSVRVLKYNQNWRELIAKIKDKLVDGGTLVFTMPNLNSINRFFHYNIPIYRTTKKEIVELLEKNDLEVLEISSFSKIPDYFYNLSNNAFYVRMLLAAERAMEKVFGKTFMGRGLFIAARKKIAST